MKSSSSKVYFYVAYFRQPLTSLTLSQCLFKLLDLPLRDLWLSHDIEYLYQVL